MMNCTKNPLKKKCKICGTYTIEKKWCNNIMHRLNYKIKIKKFKNIKLPEISIVNFPAKNQKICEN